MKAPIAIISFNRPGYLEQTLRSLKAQTGGTPDGREIHLFQDGAVNAYSRLRYADDQDIQASVDMFKAHFPEAEVHLQERNVGIYENYLCAERYMFEQREFDVVYFLEDDMVLSPVYLQMMEVMEQFARSSPRVAYFSACGKHCDQIDEIARRRRDLIDMEQHWAFGLKRAAWTQLHAFLAPYYEIVCGHDYARRNHRAIFEMFAASGVTPFGSSQDSAKAWACDQLGLWRCRTFVPFARYIGSKGAHMTPADYEAIGYGRTIVADDVIDDLLFPDDAGVDLQIAAQRARYQNWMRRELDATMASFSAAKLNPMRVCTADDVRMAYRLLLHRDPETQQIVDRHAGRTAVFSLVRGLLRSSEFSDLSGRVDHP